MAKILRVNMTEGTLKEEPLPEKYANLGGRGLTSQIVADEVPPTCHPLGPANKLVLAPGLLTGTRAPSSGRLAVGGKSPLTCTIKEANAGGVCGQKIANLGYRAIVVEGQAAPGKTYVLYMGEGGNELVEAGDLAGLGTYELNLRLRERYGEDIGVICTGPAGEMGMAAAGVSTSDMEGHPGRYAGRGGLGAVMGSKRLKAIVVDTYRVLEVPVQEEAAFNAAAQRFTAVLQRHPVTSQALPSYGTAVLVNIVNEAGALPTRNFRSGRFEEAANTSGEKLAEVVKERGGKGTTGHSCHPECVIRCSNIYPDADGEVLCAPIEYESDWALGANCGIGDLDAIARLNYLCNDLGLDTIETGAALAVAMEAGLLAFGDAREAIRLLDEDVRRGTALGRILGQGAATVGRVYGITRVGAVKGQAMPAYDPRAVKGVGVTYATSPMGADHTAGYSVASNILKVGGYVDPLKPGGQVELSRNLQVATAALDCTGLCLFVAFALLDDPEGMQALVDMLNSMYGWKLTVEDVPEVGRQVLRVERAFNQAAGFSPAHDRLPEFFLTEKVPPHDTVFDVPDSELDAVFNF